MVNSLYTVCVHKFLHILLHITYAVLVYRHTTNTSNYNNAIRIDVEL
jgi:hypothetical protein